MTKESGLGFSVTIDDSTLSSRADTSQEGYTVRSLGGGDYAVAIRRMRQGKVIVGGE